MKIFKIILILLSFMLFNINTSNATEQPTKITFIYINGSNNLAYKNRLKFKVAFEESVNKLHPEIKKRFENDENIQEKFLENGKYTINPEPIAFYWGDRSLNIVEVLDKDLKSASKYSPKIAHQARTIFTHCLHDAVWVQKPQNMARVIEDLHQVINTELKKGNKIVLLGYSAGSFVTYQYYLNRSDSFDTKTLFINKFNKNIQDIVENTNVNPTCLEALIDADIIKYNVLSGKYEYIKDQDIFQSNYSKLDEITDKACFKGGDVKGIIGFASPARLFYSDFLDAKTNINNLSLLMAKSIIYNNVFYLTVNYNNDPFGFSNATNFTFNKIKDTFLNENEHLEKNKGFIYNKSNNYVPRTFITAHLAYWETPKRFAKAIVKAFNEGYKNFYNN